MNSVEPDTQLDVNRVASNTISTTSIVGVRLFCQALALMLSARLLGVENFGLVAAIVAVSLVLGPWSGAGYDFIALRMMSRKEGTSSEHFWRGVSLIVRTSLPMIVITSAAIWSWSHDPALVELTVLVLTAELLFLRTVELVAKIFQGNDLFRDMALTRLGISLARLIVLAVIALLSSSLTAPQWGWANLVAAVIALIVAMLFIQRRLGITLPQRGGRKSSLHDGLHFAAGITSVRLSTEFDKSLVLGIAGASGAGIYGAAQRLVSLAVAPVISLVNVVITSLFRLNGYGSHVHFRQRSLVITAVAGLYGLIVGVFFWFFLPDIAVLALGEEFRALVIGLLPLSLMVLPTSCRMVGEQAVAAMGRFRQRLIVQWAVAVLSLAMNLVVISRFGWRGAAWVLVGSEFLLAMSFLAIVMFMRPRVSEPLE